MDAKLKKAIWALLDQIEDEARSSFKKYDDGLWQWDDQIWKQNDPTLYKKWRKVHDLIAA